MYQTIYYFKSTFKAIVKSNDLGDVNGKNILCNL